VEAPAPGDAGKALERLKTQESIGPPSGLNRYLEATDSRGEKGPEDEPISLEVLHVSAHEGHRAPARGTERAGRTGPKA
jgi:hypothetical protein